MRHTQAAPGAVVQATLGAVLVPLAGGSETPGPAGLAAQQAAVGVGLIAGPTDEEEPLTPAAGACAKERHGRAGPERTGVLERVGHAEP